MEYIEASFEEIWEYLQKVVSPNIEVKYELPLEHRYNRIPVPFITAPDHNDILYYYQKHFPNRQAPKLAAIEEGYEWVFEEFKRKVKARLWTLEKEERGIFITDLLSFFESLKVDKEAYSTQLGPLEQYGLELFMRLYTPAERPYMSYTGVYAQQQACALKNSIWLINEASTFLKELKSKLITSIPNKGEQEENLTFAELLNDPEKISSFVDVLRKASRRNGKSVIDDNGKWIGKKGGKSIVIAWVDVLAEKGKFKRNLDPKKLSELLNLHFPGLNFETKDASLWRKSTETNYKYHADFLQLIE